MEPGRATDIPVTVTAEDKTQQIYTITVFRAPAHEYTDRFLQGERPQEEPTPVAPEVTEDTDVQPVQTAGSGDKDSTSDMVWICVIVGIGALLLGSVSGFGLAYLILKKRNL